LDQQQVNQLLGALKKVAQEDTQQSLATKLGAQIGDALKTSGASGGLDGVADSGKTAADAISALGSVAGTTLASIGGLGADLIKGEARISSGTEAIAKVAGSIAGPFGKLADLGTDVVKFAEASVDTFRQTSTSGASFNNNILEMNNMALQSRLTLDEFAGMVTKNSAALAGFGGSVTQGADKFSKMSQNFFDKGFGDSLLQMGFTFEDVNDSLMQYAEINRRGIAEGAISDETARQSAAKMAKEMDLVAKLTGKNRKEMEEEIQGRMRSGQVQAKLRLLEQQGNFEAAEKFRLALAEAQKAGPDAVAALEETFTKGTVVSEAGRRGLVALGDAGQELSSVVQAISTKGADVGPALDRFNAAVVERVNSPEFLNMATLGGMGGVADAAATVLENAGTYADAVKENGRIAGVETTTREGILAAVEAGRTLADTEQKKREAITNSIVLAEARLKDLSATMGTGLFGDDGIIRDLGRDQGQAIADYLAGLRRADIDRAVGNLVGVERENPAPDPSSVTVSPETKAILDQINGDLRTAFEEGRVSLDNDAAKELSRLITSGNHDVVIAALEALSDDTTAAEEAAKIIETNNTAVLQTIQDGIRAQTEQSQTNAGIDPTTQSTINSMVDHINSLETLPSRLADSEWKVGKFTVSEFTNASISDGSSSQDIAAAITKIQTDQDSLITSYQTAVDGLEAKLNEISPNIEKVSTSNQEGLQNIADTISTSMQGLSEKIDQSIREQRNTTRATKANGVLG